MNLQEELLDFARTFSLGIITLMIITSFLIFFANHTSSGLLTSFVLLCLIIFHSADLWEKLSEQN